MVCPRDRGRADGRRGRLLVEHDGVCGIDAIGQTVT